MGGAGQVQPGYLPVGRHQRAHGGESPGAHHGQAAGRLGGGDGSRAAVEQAGRNCRLLHGSLSRSECSTCILMKRGLPMKRILSISTLAAALLPVAVLAAPTAGTQEVTLSGEGDSDKDFDTNVLNIQGSWGQYLNESSLWGIRQSIGISDREGESTDFNGATRIFYDYHFGVGNTRPF